MTLKHIALALTGNIAAASDEELTFDESSAQHHAGFNDYFQKNIRPLVAGYEGRRVAALKKFRVRLLLSLPAFLVAMVVLVMVLPSVDFFFILLFAGGGAVLAFVLSPLRKFKHSVKDDVFPRMFEFFNGQVNYSRTSPLSVADLKESGLIPSYDSERREDYVSGEYNGVNVEWMECKLTETQGSGKNRRTVTKFKGMILLLNVHKSFSGKTIIQNDWGKFGNWLNRRFKALERVALEDPEFEKLFEVYSSDQIEARYLLTTSFMQRLLDYAQSFGSTRLQASFYGEKLLLMVPTKEDRFETASVFEPTSFIPECKTVLDDLEHIFDIIRTLKMDQNIGM